MLWKVRMCGMLSHQYPRVLGWNTYPKRGRERGVSYFEKQMPQENQRTYLGCKGYEELLTKPHLPWVL